VDCLAGAFRSKVATGSSFFVDDFETGDWAGVDALAGEVFAFDAGAATVLEPAFAARSVTVGDSPA
jgi:hypothetical protein